MKIYFPTVGVLLAVCLLLMLLGGCASPGVTKSLMPVCTALGTHHTYNPGTTPQAKDSPYHAGPILAKRLARDNKVGTNLHCPGY